MSNNERIKYIRHLIGFSQRAFADKLGLTQNKLARIEGEKIAPQLSILNNISIMYGVNIDWLKSGEGAIFKDGSNLYKKGVSALSYNPSLLESVVIAVDELLHSEVPQRKARIITYYYEHYRQSTISDYPTIKAEIASSLKFVSELLGEK
ncbi:MAG: helix-turn-helix domain-containing protein [Deferribacteraceae bacterium]|jgi:transcriptional regulator with XRE-family HTH domain|nr:helix-turn-helix domain-containing protein [Deferribacteraceae bacterium]